MAVATTKILSVILIDVGKTILYFPVWWYSKGLMRVINFITESASLHIHRRLALGVWLKSMFKPMYGDYTKEGRIISFFMRIVVLIYKLIATGLWLVVLLAIFLIWIILPLVVVYYLLFQVFGVPIPFLE